MFDMRLTANSFFFMSAPWTAIVILVLIESIRRCSKFFSTMITSNVKIAISYLSVVACMNTLSGQVKIFDAIIKAVSVFVMDYFVRLKFSTKVLFHKMSVFIHLLSVNINNLISLPNTTASFWGIFANGRIAMSLPSSIMECTPSSFPTIFPVGRPFTTVKLTNCIHSILLYQEQGYTSNNI